MTDFIWSDLHLNHPTALRFNDFRKQFSCVEEMNEGIIDRHNSIVGKRDRIIFLGDICLGEKDEAAAMVSRLNGIKTLIWGNHDTDAKIKSYFENGTFEKIALADLIKIGKKTFYLNHYPTLTCDPRHCKPEKTLWTLHGHTHAETAFSNVPGNFHVGIETFEFPIALEEVVKMISESGDEFCSTP